MRDLQNFYNQGFGWICLNCENNLPKNDLKTSRLMSEGEAESKNPELSNQALAKWADVEKQTLICPRCGISEKISV